MKIRSDSESIDSFSSINERPVDDISLDFFYKPHTITLLLVSIAGVIYSAFVRYIYYIFIMFLGFVNGDEPVFSWVDVDLMNWTSNSYPLPFYCNFLAIFS